ncbi:ADP-ribosylation factor GTPase-activating protein, putative [Pediculus humanus corporis]|uniref:ADP-ribosylation factor GTPase-activating protein, putative n=1 Tax=Pediculus humanus subsp. corporis TaxID=121224 RepID=E0VKG7_PEDHC|nr:ADP-ribosylation factor GTPase-activating protein, putative [Pediculus humanus corporis]EEB13847.1 ADP-ribosylation factor GTPase-activating protein, putative [Pediculus humanus corporis]
MADNSPSKSDIQAIFKKLRAVATNKSCFDCNAKNPTWSSVTYGVFICIDCSAVHRSLGVHVTFVRSTQLDTNWTWVQLRQMQLGGNANAANFFRQHNCHTTDAQQKYTSRAAQLYKDKLKQAAVQAMKIHGTKLHLEPSNEKPEDNVVKEIDFFEEHSTANDNFDESFTSHNLNDFGGRINKPNNNNANVNANLSQDGGFNRDAPTVNLSAQVSAPEGERKSLIGGRKIQAKSGLGARKTGKLGAQKIKTNFAEIEREAEIMDQLKERQAEEAKLLAEKTAEEEQKQMASMRLAYKDLSLQQKKEEEKLKQTNPTKAQQIERLGMGFSVKSGISHSALSDMQTIEQENTLKPSSSSNENKNLDSLFFDGNSGRDRYTSNSKESKTNQDSGFENEFSLSLFHRDRSYKGWNSTSDAMSFSSSFDEKPNPVKESESSSRSSSSRRDPPLPASTCDDAQKKFGNAKAISSDQYFGDSSSNNWERKANLSRFEGSSSISSADFFGDRYSNSQHQSSLASSISAPDLDDVKESVRQGVTKVAGKISSLANGVLSSIQDRYGY